jgi:hypothetical protein
MYMSEALVDKKLLPRVIDVVVTCSPVRVLSVSGVSSMLERFYDGDSILTVFPSLPFPSLEILTRETCVF